VDENDLCLLGGFPGGKDGEGNPGALRKTLGIWSEETDALYPGQENRINWQGRQYRAFELCELLHNEGAETLGVYAEDFYTGYPALTCNAYGKGKAYFIAARTGDDFLDDFYGAIAAETGLEQSIPGLEGSILPQGISAAFRTADDKRYTFLLNCSNEAKEVSFEGKAINLSAYEALII
jgi:beta-galactosidase